MSEKSIATELAVYEGAGELIVPRPPEVVLTEARQAAVALKEVLENKARKVMFSGEQYLEFEDWQTLGRFYGITAKCIGCHEVTYSGVAGFEAVAQAIRADEAVISQAEAVCMRDEPNWVNKPIYQLKSMAQTRACAKVLRNVLAWVVVLAGYRPTPAEEIEGVTGARTVNTGSGEQAKPPSEGMTRLVHVLLGKLGYKDSQQKHEYCTGILARPQEKPIKTLDQFIGPKDAQKPNPEFDLTFDEAKTLIDTLQRLIAEKEKKAE